jgi:hypothetical protein
VELESALKPISDQLLRELDELAAIESEKRDLKPEDDRTLVLAVRARELAQRVLAASVVEEQVARTANDTTRAPSPPQTPSSRTRQRALHLILEEWREAERRLEMTSAPEEHHAQSAKARALRDEYQRAFEAIERREPPRPGGQGG